VLRLCAPVANSAARAEQTAPSYTLIDLGTLRGTNTVAVDINGAGQMVGYGYLPDDAEERVLS
jgi:hypothetical protein